MANLAPGLHKHTGARLGRAASNLATIPIWQPGKRPNLDNLAHRPIWQPGTTDNLAGLQTVLNATWLLRQPGSRPDFQPGKGANLIQPGCWDHKDHQGAL